MSNTNSPKRLPSTRSRVRRIVLGAVSMAIIIAAFVLVTLLRPFPSLVDRAAAESSAISNTVSTEQLQAYCPSRMALLDTEAYGDSEYQVSSGDIASSARYAAFGSVYRSLVGPLTSDISADVEQLEADEVGDVMTLTGTVDDAATVVDTQLLQSQTGTGVAASVASWATEGDLQGLSAATCVVPALDQAFLLTDTNSGVTQQLIVANPTDRATAVTVLAWGTENGERVSLSTGNTLTVDAYGEASVDLAAAASDLDGLYVTVSSEETPVAAVVRTVTLDGLTPMGSEYALPVADASRTAMLPGVREGDAVGVEVFGESDTDVTMYWVTENGYEQAAEGEADASRVAVFDLQSAPEGALGVMVEASEPVVAVARATQAGDDQSDFALIDAAEPAESAAVVLPDDVDGELTLMNGSSDEVQVTLHAYDADGVAVDEREITIPAESATSLSVADVNEDACLLELEDTGSAVSWGARLTSPTLDDADVAGLAYLGATALTPVSEEVSAEYDQSIVQ